MPQSSSSAPPSPFAQPSPHHRPWRGAPDLFALALAVAAVVGAARAAATVLAEGYGAWGLPGLQRLAGFEAFAHVMLLGAFAAAAATLLYVLVAKAMPWRTIPASEETWGRKVGMGMSWSPWPVERADWFGRRAASLE